MNIENAKLEQRIRELEEENARLKSLLVTERAFTRNMSDAIRELRVELAQLIEERLDAALAATPMPTHLAVKAETHVPR